LKNRKTPGAEDKNISASRSFDFSASLTFGPGSATTE
jgi:hypothetical protein